MTREEAYKLVMRACEKTWNEKTCKQIKEALEQEPILNKIRAELHATSEMHEDGNYYLREEWIDEIIDKYRGDTNGRN